MEIRARLAFGRDAVDCTHRLPVDQDDALVAVRHLRKEFLGNQGLARCRSEHFVQRGKVPVITRQVENSRAAVAIERLEYDVSVSCRKFAYFIKPTRDHCRRRQIRKLKHKQLFRKIPYPKRVVDHERVRYQFEQMRGRDVTRVERRILAEPDDVEGVQRRDRLLAKPEMVALHAPHFQGPSARRNAPFLPEDAVRMIVEQFRTPGLSLFRQPERRVGLYVYQADGIHLYRDSVVYHSDFSSRAMFPRARSPQPATLRSPGITTPPSAFRKMLIAAL